MAKPHGYEEDDEFVDGTSIKKKKVGKKESPAEHNKRIKPDPSWTII